MQTNGIIYAQDLTDSGFSRLGLGPIPKGMRQSIILVIFSRNKKMVLEREGARP